MVPAQPIMAIQDIPVTIDPSGMFELARKHYGCSQKPNKLNAIAETSMKSHKTNGQSNAMNAVKTAITTTKIKCSAVKTKKTISTI